jgi:sugar/nucleoside kinase (ribokinase family)
MKPDQKANALEIQSPIEYLVIGHLTTDLNSDGYTLGGTASFSGLTAHALGLRTGIVSAFHPGLDTSPLEDIWIANKSSAHTTTFKNISDGLQRSQYLYEIAESIHAEDIPALKSPPTFLHLGPVANEVDSQILALFPDSLKCLTPQGWFRIRDKEKKVVKRGWKNAETIFSQADVAVISQDDVDRDEDLIHQMACSIPVFVVTESARGARVYWHNDARYFNAPEVKYVEDTGAGDIFATAFFYRYHITKDPWAAGRFAVQLASWSVTRRGLNSIPLKQEIHQASIEIINR